VHNFYDLPELVLDELFSGFDTKSMIGANNITGYFAVSIIKERGD